MQERRAVLDLKPENLALIGVDANADRAINAGVFGGGRIVGRGGGGDDGEGSGRLLGEGGSGGENEHAGA